MYFSCSVCILWKGDQSLRDSAILDSDSIFLTSHLSIFSNIRTAQVTSVIKLLLNEGTPWGTPKIRNWASELWRPLLLGHHEKNRDEDCTRRWRPVYHTGGKEKNMITFYIKNFPGLITTSLSREIKVGRAFLWWQPLPSGNHCTFPRLKTI